MLPEGAKFSRISMETSWPEQRAILLVGTQRREVSFRFGSRLELRWSVQRQVQAVSKQL